MKKLSFFLTLCALLLIFSCNNDEEPDCSDYDLDFQYSLGFPVDSSFASVEFSEANNNLPPHADVEWTVNGDNEIYLYDNTTRFTENGHFSITMIVTVDNLVCSASKEFEVTEIR